MHKKVSQLFSPFNRVHVDEANKCKHNKVNTDKDCKNNFANAYHSLISMKSVFNIKMSYA